MSPLTPHESKKESTVYLAFQYLADPHRLKYDESLQCRASHPVNVGYYFLSLPINARKRATNVPIMMITRKDHRCPQRALPQEKEPQKLPRLLIISIVSLALSVSFSSSCHAREPGWSPHVVLPNTKRDKIQSKEIIHRPYRPLHFYGNTVRRRYHRGVARPTTNDLQTTVEVLLGR